MRLKNVTNLNNQVWERNQISLFKYQFFELTGPQIYQESFLYIHVCYPAFKS